VDQLLRGELEVLQTALVRDLASKGKKARKASKKGRSGKKSKKKKEKDLTPDRTLESLFEELVTNGIIRKYTEVRLSEFRGERSYAAHDLRKQGKDPLPSLGDIRQVILEYCILPLGSKTVHQMAPLIKSVLLVGSHGSGKDMLVHAVCTETGSVLFDLSPANITGKYPGKSGLIMLVSNLMGDRLINILVLILHNLSY
jgi:SpoVK/Ycf46/Vps4 family AAA+-type ATPase